MKILSNNRVGTAALQLAEDGDLALLARSGSKALSSKSKAKASAGKKKSDDPECLDKATLIFVIGKKAQDSCKRNLFQRVFTFDWGCERAKAKAEASATSFGETCPVDEDDNGLKSKAKSKLDDDVEESESVEDGSSYDVDKSSDDKYSDSDAAYCKKNPKSKLCK
jgi:hypothetical protein